MYLKLLLNGIHGKWLLNSSKKHRKMGLDKMNLHHNLTKNITQQMVRLLLLSSRILPATPLNFKDHFRSHFGIRILTD